MSATPVRARFLFQGRAKAPRELDSSAEIIDDTPEHRYLVVTVSSVLIVLVVLTMLTMLTILTMLTMLTMLTIKCRPFFIQGVFFYWSPLN